jgi:hypothetical protein
MGNDDAKYRTVKVPEWVYQDIIKARSNLALQGAGQPRPAGHRQRQKRKAPPDGRASHQSKADDFRRRKS